MKISGKEIAEKIYAKLKKRVGELNKKNIIPHLVVFLVGENPASVAYVALKQKKGEEIGARVTLLDYPTTVTTDELLDKLNKLNDDSAVHGILIQRPLPDQINVEKLEMSTNPEKDIDGFHPNSPYTLPLPLAVVRILEEIYFKFEAQNPKSETNLNNQNTNDENALSFENYNSDIVSSFDIRNSDFFSWLKSQKIIILGKGPTGGGPIMDYLKKLDVPFTLIDSKTVNPDEIMRHADIIAGAVGRENIITPEKIKKGVILVGVGILRGEDGKLKGDYDVEKIKDIAGYYTPTPGGVGPVNVAKLMENLITAAEKQS